MMTLLAAADAAGDSATDQITAAVAVAALVASCLALWYNHRSAKAAELAAVASGAAAKAAKTSADAAERVAQAELERDHEMYRPTMPDPEVAFVRERNERTGEMNLFLVFALPKGYRVEGETMTGSGRSPLGMSPTIETGRPVRVFIDDLPDNRKGQPGVELVRLRFWPPADEDQGERWTCRCGRPVSPEGGVHWEWSKNVPKQPHLGKPRIVGPRR